MQLVKSNTQPLHGIVESQRGGRQENQDDFGFQDTPLGFFLVVCDGMGGGPAGKTASYVVRCEMLQALVTCAPHMPRAKAMQMAAGRAHAALLRLVEENPSLMGFGSTFVSILINGDSALIAHAGDSRCYVMRGKHMLFRTQDHSLVAELVRRKALTEEQARVSPQSNVISRGMGCLSNNVPDITEIPYKKGDRFILCTDGVWGCMPHNKLLRRFAALHAVRMHINQFVSEIDSIGNSTGGHHDNHTVAVVEMERTSTIAARKSRHMMFLSLSVAVIIMAVLLLCLFFCSISNKKSRGLAFIGSEESVVHIMDEGNTRKIEYTEDREFSFVIKECIAGVKQSQSDVENVMVSADNVPHNIEDKDKADNSKDTVFIALDVLGRMYSALEQLDSLYKNNIRSKSDSLKQVLKESSNQMVDMKKALPVKGEKINAIHRLLDKPKKVKPSVVTKVKQKIRDLISELEKYKID